MSIPPILLIALRLRHENNLLRNLPHLFNGIDFISNDYLGFSKLNLLSKKIEGDYIAEMKITGSGGSRLISGNSVFIEDIEKKIAHHHQAEAALVFNSGYDANLGLLSSVPQKNDLVITDEFIHASIYDGVRLSFAKHYKFKHNSISDLEELLQRHASHFENVYIVVESVYSMDGDEAPLLDIVSLREKYKNVFVIVDEAHAIGVFGKKGAGLCQVYGIEEQCFARVYTYGKAMGCHGAAIVGSNDLRNYLINFARSFIYTTALPIHSVAAISAAYDLLEDNTQQNQLQNNIAYFIESVKHINGFIKSKSAIQCMLLHSNQKAMALENALLKQSILCKAVKSPTVKAGTERIRFCLHAYNTKEEIDLLLNYLQTA